MKVYSIKLVTGRMASPGLTHPWKSNPVVFFCVSNNNISISFTPRELRRNNYLREKGKKATVCAIIPTRPRNKLSVIDCLLSLFLQHNIEISTDYVDDDVGLVMDLNFATEALNTLN